MRTPMNYPPSPVGLCSLVRLGFSLSHGDTVIRNSVRKDKAGTCDRLTIGAMAGKQGRRLRDDLVADGAADTGSSRAIQRIHL